LVLKLEGGSFHAQERATASSMMITSSDRVEGDAVTTPSSARGSGVTGDDFGDKSPGPARTPPRKSVTGVGGTRISASPQVRVPCAASGQGLVAVNSPTSNPAEAFKKRKRPPALNISNDMLTHGAGVSMRPATENDLRDAGAAEETVVVEGDTFALSSKRGKRRQSCEDAYNAAPGLDGDPTQGIFSVFDGHGGREAADYGAAYLHEEILREVRLVESSEAGTETGFVENIKAAMIRGFLATDRAFLAEGHLHGGATATTAYLRGGRIWVANVGDCRAVMREGGEAKALTHDHRPDKAEDRDAVERRGGEIVKVKGTSRVQGVLGVSRALGDRDLKEYITAEPEVFSGLVSETSEFLILGTDGLWDVVGNMEATDVVARAMTAASRGGNVRKGTDSASRELVDLARTRGSRDDISVLIVELREYRAGASPATSPEGKGT
jgi:protein phosphatase 1L